MIWVSIEILVIAYSHYPKMIALVVIDFGSLQLSPSYKKLVLELSRGTIGFYSRESSGSMHVWLHAYSSSCSHSCNDSFLPRIAKGERVTIPDL